MTDTALRAIAAAVQRARPSAFLRRRDAGDRAPLSFEVERPEDIEATLAARPGEHGVLRVGEQRFAIAARAEDLVVGDEHAQDCAGPLAGSVAVVSGAASGLGLGVARGLYDAGASVVFTDIDAAGLDQIARTIDDPARVATAAIDVTDERSVSAGFDSAIARFGRIDTVACCAGVAPAHDLVDFPLDRWRLALEINLTGYFLYGREAARVMKAQGHGGSMVLLSSKSGLEPSKANSAYNATKAGELHLARGWALELGRDGIRVNCIAPGNVFEGSKIWNPDYIAKAAQKKGIRPDQVIPFYTSLTALDREIKPTDIANAAVFLASERARCITGQVLVVDSGQAWAR